MHGLIFETSIWLLAGSTRYLTGSSESEDRDSLDPEAVSRQKVRKLLRRPPQSQETFTSETEPCAFHNFHTVQFVGCQVRCIKSASELAPHFGPKKAGIRSKISKKVRYHLQSFELGPHRSNWRKKPPRTGRFFIIDANNNRKKNAVAVSMKKQTTGGQPQKKNHRRERRIRNPRTQTPIRCQRIYNRSSQGYSAKTSKPNRTPKNEPRWFKPLENDWILIFFLFYPYYFLNAAVAPCLLLHDCIFWQVWATHTCFVQTGFLKFLKFPVENRK